MLDLKTAALRVASLLKTHQASLHKGQGVVEYAGAIVIAVIVVSGGLVVVPPAFSAMFSTIDTSVQAFLTNAMPK